jgi:hypothetical protein
MADIGLDMLALRGEHVVKEMLPEDLWAACGAHASGSLPMRTEGPAKTKPTDPPCIC